MNLGQIWGSECVDVHRKSINGQHLYVAFVSCWAYDAQNINTSFKVEKALLLVCGYLQASSMAIVI